jgi:hypothetical protein
MMAVGSQDQESEAVRTAQAAISGTVPLIDACVRMARLAHDLVPSWAEDPDFVVFGIVASETGHLPLGEVRKQWSAQALAKADDEIERICDFYGSQILTACTNIVARYSRVH